MVLEQGVDRARAPIPAQGGAEGQHLVSLAQLEIELLFEYRLAVLGTAALAVHDQHAADVAAPTLVEKLLQHLAGVADGESVQIQFQADLEMTTAKLLEQAFLHPGAAELQELRGLDLMFGVEVAVAFLVLPGLGLPA